MAAKKPLVITNGQIEQLQSGDTLDAPVSEVDVITLTNNSGSTVEEGQAVCPSGTSGECQAAQANAQGTVQVIGLADEQITNGNSGVVQTDGIKALSDWTSVIGATSLTPGTVYYLDPSTAGRLTATAPTSAGQYVVRVGLALSNTELDVSVQAPVKL